jgi:hypothetical protein
LVCLLMTLYLGYTSSSMLLATEFKTRALSSVMPPNS